MIRIIIFSLILLPFHYSAAQDKLLDELEEEETTWDLDVDATFKGTRLINGQSVETRKMGILEFVISHRFGNINSGAYNFFGLDESNIRLALEYGVTDDLYIGVGRSSYLKTFDGFLKYRLVRQQQSGGSPVSVTLFTSGTIETFKQPEDTRDFLDRLAYTTQVLVARKFGPAVSFQLMPTYTHFNTITSSALANDVFALGIGGRVKISKRIAVTSEYYYQIDRLMEDSRNSLAIGIDIETGGHVFQLIFTNSRSMVEKGFIFETTDDFFDGDIRFGFNITRAFQLTHKN